MAVTIEQGTVQMTEQGDSFNLPSVVQSVRFVAGAGQLAADEIVLTDPVSNGELWRTYGGSPTDTEAELIGTGDRGIGNMWHNGFTLSSLPGNRGTVYVRIK